MKKVMIDASLSIFMDIICSILLKLFSACYDFFGNRQNLYVCIKFTIYKFEYLKISKLQDVDVTTVKMESEIAHLGLYIC